MRPFVEAVKGVFVNAPRPSPATLLGRAWASFDSAIKAAATQFDTVRELAGVEEKVAALEKRVIEAEDSFAEMTRSLEQHGATLKVKEAQPSEVIGKLRYSEEQTAFEVRSCG